MLGVINQIVAESALAASDQVITTSELNKLSTVATHNHIVRHAT